MDAEVWRDVDGYEGLYQVSNFGRVKSFHKGGRIRKPKNTGGYLQLNLSDGDKIEHLLVHRLVAQAFIPNPDNKPQVNHINGDKSDNRVENLEWCTRLENAHHAAMTGLYKSGGDNPQAKLTDEQVVFIRNNPKGLSLAELALMFNVTSVTIGYAQCGKKYRGAGGTIRTPNPKTPRLSDDIRAEIRCLYVKGSREFGSVALAKRFGVDHSTILNIVHEK